MSPARCCYKIVILNGFPRLRFAINKLKYISLYNVDSRNRWDCTGFNGWFKATCNTWCNTIERWFLTAIGWDRATEENWAFRLKSGTNDGPIGIGLKRNRVLNLVRLNRGGLSNVTARNSTWDPIGKLKTYIYFLIHEKNSKLARQLCVTVKSEI